MDNDIRRARGMRDPAADMASSRVGRFGLLPSLLEEFFVPNGTAGQSSAALPLDIEETPTSYVVRADLPGVDKSAIQVELHENTLTISAERKDERESNGTPVWRERMYGRLTRSIQLPQAVDPDDVQATQANGTLRLVLLKRAVKETRRIQIS